MIKKAVAKRFIVVQFDIPGCHWYPDAPEVTAFLRNPHRHLFKFKVFIGVNHSNRDVEFLKAQSMMKEWILTEHNLCSDARCKCGNANFKTRSCEQIAEELGAFCMSKNWDVLSIEVWEDGENAGGISWAS